MSKTLYLIDGYNLIYQSYFALRNRPLLNPQGRNSSAVYGFFRTLLQIKRERNPSHLLVALDSKTKTFRHSQYPLYKAQRDATPEELHTQVTVIEEILKALGIPALRIDGYEADDIIASIVKKCREQDFSCFIVSKDKDILQTIGAKIAVLRQPRGQSHFDEWGREEVFNNYGVYPEQIVDYLALTGDSSDNIPGVRGIGPKNAAKLLAEFKTLDNIYKNIENVLPQSQKNKLINDKDNAYLSRSLIILNADVPLDCSLQDLKVKSLNTQAAIPLFAKEGMKTIIEELGGKSQEDTNYNRTKPGTYTTITSEPELISWIKEAKSKGICSFDVETDSKNDILAKPLGFSLCTEAGRACYIPIAAAGIQCLSEKLVKEALINLLEDPQLKIIGQNIKYDYKVLKRWGVNIKNLFFDTMIAAWLMESGAMSSYNMDRLALKYLNFQTIKYTDLIEKGSDLNLSQIDIRKASDYAGEDADITFRLYKHFERKLKEQELESVFYDIEMPLIKVLAAMELTGIRVLPAQLSTLSKQLALRLENIQQEVYRLCQTEFNLNSTKQLQEVLFKQRKLTPVKKTKTGYSTDTQVLAILAQDDEVPRLILEHRTLSKLKNTYLDTLPNLINPHTNRIHTQFIQTGTATGRLSSKDPNLQNIPIRDEEGRKIREAFIPRAGSLFISADYSQIELVVLAHLASDSLLIEAFHKGRDIHMQTASIIFDTEIENISAEQRRIGKTINFGVIYGMSAFRLARDLKIGKEEARSFIKSYFEKYAGVKEYIEKTVRFAEQHEFVKTLMGRKRRLATINSKNRTEKMAAERVAVNTTIQGSAADIVKCAMKNIFMSIEQNKIAAKLILQVHDELIFEVAETEKDKASALIKKQMESVIDLQAPLKVNIEAGQSWGSIH